MQSRLITNLFLLLLVIVLGTFLFIDEVDQNGTKKLSPVSADSINQISIHHQQREILLNKSGQQWFLVKPIEIAANQFRIKTLLNLLSTDSLAQYNRDDLKLNNFGFNTTDTHISFNNTKISFGMTNPMNNLRYVEINNKLHLINDHFYPLLSSQIGTLIARELLANSTNIIKMILPEQTLTRDQNKLWRSTDDISSDAIVETIYQWTHKQAFSVHDYVERESLGEIQVYFENLEQPIKFTITDIEPWLIIARPDLKLEYHFNLEDYDALLRPGIVKPLNDEARKESDVESIQVSPDEFMNAIQPQ